MKNKDRFLEELTALTKRFDIKIDGCGCCGSPFLEEETEHDDKVYLAPSDSELTYGKPS